MKSPMVRISTAIAVGILAAGAQVATAQPGRGHGPGFGGPGGFEQMIFSLKPQLDLTTSQQTMWDSVVANAKAARTSTRSHMEQMHAAFKAELAKPEPDLAAIAALSDQAQADAIAARRQVRDQWLALYATFSPAQKGVVRDALVKREQRMEAFRERMQERGRAARAERAPAR